MCGIAGFVDLDLDAAAARALGEKMCGAILHRGRDGGGVSTHEDATLGMRRLAIVDIANGLQPMANYDDSIVLVYNGEVYNAPELRKGLEREGVRFRTRSDTEVILRLYERDPARIEEFLVGMWAFAIHDRKRRRLLLSRDRFGIKPLFVADAGRSLAFASELRSFDALRDRSGFAPLFALDKAAAHAMLSWSYVPEQETIYSGVKRLAPGTRLEVDLTSGQRTRRTYWTPRPSSDAARVRSLHEARDMVEPLLRRAVREHLESDVPIASFLSGGIDSSLVTALAVEASHRPIEAFTIGFREPRFDEAPYARATAQVLGIRINVDYLDEKVALHALGDALVSYDEPFGDSSSLATRLLSRLVGAGHKVALAGDGGDEVFAGYKKHRIVAARDAVAMAPAMRDGVARLLGAMPTRTDRTSWITDGLRILRRVSRGLQGEDAVAYAALTQIGSLEKTAPLVRTTGSPERFLHPAEERFRAATGSQLQRTLACDLANPLPNDMLTKVDRASMSCHLEVRVPFLDHRVVEVGLGLPSEYTLGSSGKEVLRLLHQQRFGRRLARRRKQGFGVPVEQWLRGQLAPACDALFSTDRLDRFGLLASEALGAGRWRTWAVTDPQLLWNAFALAAWCEVALGDGPEALRNLLPFTARRGH